jgi:hypothetical protein
MGKYCSAVRDAIVADGEVRCIDMESLRIELGDTDLARSPIAKYPPSVLSGSTIMITVLWCCDQQSWRDATGLVSGAEIKAVPP